MRICKGENMTVPSKLTHNSHDSSSACERVSWGCVLTPLLSNNRGNPEPCDTTHGLQKHHGERSSQAGTRTLDGRAEPRPEKRHSGLVTEARHGAACGVGTGGREADCKGTQGDFSGVMKPLSSLTVVVTQACNPQSSVNSTCKTSVSLYVNRTFYKVDLKKTNPSLKPVESLQLKGGQNNRSDERAGGQEG